MQRLGLMTHNMRPFGFLPCVQHVSNGHSSEQVHFNCLLQLHAGTCKILATKKAKGLCIWQVGGAVHVADSGNKSGHNSDLYQEVA